MINLKLPPDSCSKPRVVIKCNESTEDPPKYKVYGIHESDEFDGDIFIDHSLKVDKNNQITEYLTFIRYTPDKDGKGFKLEELD